MAWQNEMVRIVRYLINDLGTTPTYADSRLEETLLVAAQLMQHEINFDQTYTVEVDNATLSPDPTTGTKDDGFVNLTCLKAACIVFGSEFKTNAASAISVTDGPSKIDFKGASDATKALYEDMCKKFDQAKLQYQAGNSRAGAAVLTPYTYEGIGPRKGHFS